MKKTIALVLFVLCFFPAFAANNKKNTMKMVSYFPVPYVAYDNVSANQSIDVGILNTCELALGPGDSNLGGSNCSLYLWGDKAGNDLKRGLLNVTSGALMLNSADIANPLIKSEKVLAGSGGTAGTGWLDIGRPAGKKEDFEALYVSSIANKGNSLRVTGLTNRGNDVASKVDSFKMFDQIKTDFPSDCNGEATWQAAELGGDMNANKTFTDIYLICNGEGGSTPPEPDPEPELTCADYSYKVSHKSQCCPSASQSDTVCYYKSKAYEWVVNSGFSMTAAFGSNWMTQVCSGKCWDHAQECGGGALGVIGDHFFSSGKYIQKSCDSSCSHTCSGNICDQGWFETFRCDGEHIDMTYILLSGYNNSPWLAYCPPKGSGKTPYYNGSVKAWTCMEKETVMKNGW